MALPMELHSAIRKVEWAALGDLNHPTSCSQYRKQEDGSIICDCGLWAALETVSRHRFGRLLRDWEAGVKPR